MEQFKNKRFYKGISLFIKSLVLVLSFYYIWQKVTDSSVIWDHQLFETSRIFLLPCIFLLMFVNWGLESYKWILLTRPLETISFSSSFRAVMAGVTVSLLTPNRVGEFAARVLFLKKSDKIMASVASLVGSVIQLLVTIIAGAWAYFFLERKYYDFFQTEEVISTDMVLYIFAGIALLGFLLWYFFLSRIARFRKYTEVLSLFSKKEMNGIWLLSFTRYLVFAFQYYLALRLFGINAGVMILFALIALTFFVTSAIPTFALTEIAVRTGAAVYFFGTISTDLNGIIAASLCLWLINIAVPAAIGGVFIWKLKLFRES
ncbi:MAG: lysylphosphatidylglycerol synthase domain-containing protein [Bacteroidia bacterium]